jgi:hypothetical protein
VYVGSSYLGTVNARAAAWRWRDIAVGTTTSHHGKVRLVAATQAPVFTQYMYLLR